MQQTNECCVISNSDVLASPDKINSDSEQVADQVTKNKRYRAVLLKHSLKITFGFTEESLFVVFLQRSDMNTVCVNK